MLNVPLVDIWLTPYDYEKDVKLNDVYVENIKNNPRTLHCRKQDDRYFLDSKDVGVYRAMQKAGIEFVNIALDEWDALEGSKDSIAWTSKAKKLIEKHGMGEFRSRTRLTEAEVNSKFRTAEIQANVPCADEDPYAWARAVQQMMDHDLSLTIECLAHKLGISEERLNERLKMLWIHDESVAKAEKHGKVLGRQELNQQKREEIIRGTIIRKSCASCKNRYPAPGSSMCSFCNDKKCPCGKPMVAEDKCISCLKKAAIEEAMTPQQRGLVRCLEPNCPKWIKPKKVRPLMATNYFCKEHQLVTRDDDLIDQRGISNMPLVDRDGDPIWVTRELDVIKIKNMGDEHLTNCLIHIEESAKKRCAATQLDTSKWREKASPRYAYLLAEAKRRDDKLRCICKDGVLSTTTKVESRSLGPIPAGTSSEVIEVLCDNCQLGRDRKAAKLLAEKMAQGKKLTAKMATVMIMSLIVGGVLAPGSHVIEWVIHYLRASGCIK